MIFNNNAIPLDSNNGTCYHACNRLLKLPNSEGFLVAAGNLFNYMAFEGGVRISQYKRGSQFQDLTTCINKDDFLRRQQPELYRTQRMVTQAWPHWRNKNITGTWSSPATKLNTGIICILRMVQYDSFSGPLNPQLWYYVTTSTSTSLNVTLACHVTWVSLHSLHFIPCSVSLTVNVVEEGGGVLKF